MPRQWIMDKGASGFTMVELVIVILVIGILASMALPRLGGNVGTAAANANAQSIAGAMGAAAANRNARCTVGLIVPCTDLTCPDALLLVGGINPADYTLGGTSSTGCTVRHIDGNSDYTTVPIIR